MSSSKFIPLLQVEDFEQASTRPNLPLHAAVYSGSSSSANSKQSSTCACEPLDSLGESPFGTIPPSPAKRVKTNALETSFARTFHHSSSHSAQNLRSASDHQEHASLESKDNNTVPSQNEVSSTENKSNVCQLWSAASSSPPVSRIPSTESNNRGMQSRMVSPLSLNSLEIRPTPVHHHKHSLAHHPVRAGVAVDINPTGFLLERAAKTAERQLRERALEAFPNDDRHQPISHFLDQAETPIPSSRASVYDGASRSSSIEMELSHHSTLHQRRYLKRDTDLERREARRKLQRRIELDSLEPEALPLPIECQNELSKEMAAMLRSASPPLLGQDIVFPRSESPQPARFDITQGTEYLKRTICYSSSDQLTPSTPSSTTLWSPQKPEPPESFQESQPISRTPSNCGGLWGAIDASMFAPSGLAGIATPRVEGEKHLESGWLTGLAHLPPSPPASHSGLATLAERLEAEAAIAQEAEAELAARVEQDFDDTFVTQVFNYLSLGYPAVARDFDRELSKISGISVSELRHDDRLPSSRGYIRLNDEEVFDGVTKDMCARWKALKLYIHEWGRQQPGWLQAPGGGVPVRKGSWGA